MRKRILWIASWYPHTADPLTGDFIERHAKAVSLLHDVTLIFVVRGNRRFQKKIIEYNANFRAIIVEYAVAGRMPLNPALQYFKWQLTLVREYIAANGKPDYIHVHVAYRAGLIALYCKRYFGVPYIVSEHWSGFLPQAKKGFLALSPLKRYMIRKIFRSAAQTTAVSSVLAEAIAQRLRIPPPLVVPNVVDASVFYPAKAKHEVFTFLHVSQLNYPKNAEALLEATAKLSKQTTKDFRLEIYGPIVPALLSRSKELQISDYVKFNAEIPQSRLALAMQSADCLILYSRYETFGCVVIESLSCGVPVIVSDIPALREKVDEMSGLVVPLNDTNSLTAAMLKMLNGEIAFDMTKVAETVREQYGFERVAGQFSALYT